MMHPGTSPPAKELATPGTPRKIDGAQNISRMCLVCGRDNPFGLHARFYELAPEEPAAAGATEPSAAAAVDPAAGRELLGVFTPREEHQSYPGRLHGGVSSAILDETIGRAILLVEPGAWGVTAEFTIRFRKPLPLDGEIRCVGRLTRDTSRLFEGSGEILLPDGSVAVEASGKYVKMTIAGITDDDFAEREWFTDPREAPDHVDL
jgi:acyl-coenzyme A thioesterase PaaI-like protein